MHAFTVQRIVTGVIDPSIHPRIYTAVTAITPTLCLAQPSPAPPLPCPAPPPFRNRKYVAQPRQQRLVTHDDVIIFFFSAGPHARTHAHPARSASKIKKVAAAAAAEIPLPPSPTPPNKANNQSKPNQTPKTN